MNYQRIYNEFIADRRVKEADLLASGEYNEKHHIVPRSLGGSDDADNLIALTAGDHYFAHLCLAKIHGGSQWYAVVLAADWNHSGQEKKKLFGCRQMVDIARKKSAEVSSEFMTEFKNRPEEKEKMRNALKSLWQDPAYVKKIKASRKKVMQSDEYRQKMSIALSGEKNPMFGYEWSEEQKKRMRKNCKAGVTKYMNSLSSEEKKEKFGSKNMGGNNPNAASVMCVETGDVFSSMAEAAEWAGMRKLSSPKIGQVCRGEKKSFGGYRWVYA